MKIYLDPHELVKATDLPSQEYVDRVLNSVQAIPLYWDYSIGSMIYEASRRPQDNGVFGMKWVEKK